MSVSASKFVYSPLQSGEIRLLYPAVQGEKDVWSLKTVSLDSHGLRNSLEFDALSYTWGDQSHIFPFVCNGQELGIHQNLKEALPYLARRESPFPIWVDAVCINQSDDAEKLAQVRLMHTIYRQANQVWVWLGRGTQYNKDAIALLPLIAKVGERLQSISPNDKSTPESLGFPDLSSPIWDAIYGLINNKWYRRLWIVQEVALAQRIRVLYGKEEVDWEALERAIDFGANMGFRIMDVNGRRPEKGFENNHIVFLVRQCYYNPPGPTWVAALRRIVWLTARAQHCSEPRDRVLGILGFMTEEQIKEVGIHDGLSDTELYVTLTHFLLSRDDLRGQGWWYLFHLSVSPNKRRVLPSWCPDYHDVDTHASTDIETLLPSNHAEYSYCAGKNATSVASQGYDIRSFSVCGKAFDTISKLYPQIPDFSTADSNVNRLDRLLELYEWERSLIYDVLDTTPHRTNLEDTISTSISDNGPNIEVSIDDYWRTLVGNLTNPHGYILTYDHYEAFREGLGRYKSLIDRLSILLGDRSLVDGLSYKAEELTDMDRETIDLAYPGTRFHEFYLGAIGMLRNRRLLRTSKGYFGFGPAAIEKGDMVCVLNYAKPAHILRPCKDMDKEVYTLVGQAYIHGIMNGEIESLGVEEKVFMLMENIRYITYLINCFHFLMY